MKKVVHPNQQQQPILQRKVYGNNPTQQQDQQMNTAKKISSLLSSGAVSVTGPTQQRIVSKQQQPQKVMHIGQSSGPITKHCYVCDEVTIGPAGMPLTDALTTHTGTKVPNKIGGVVGNSFMVIICVDDVVCKRCMQLFNHMDRLEHDLDRVKANIMNLINKKYGITDDGTSPATGAVNKSVHQPQQPPQKMQRLNTGQAYATNRKTSNGADAEEEVTVTRRVNTSTRTIDPLDTSLTNMFDSPGSDKPQQLRTNTTITPVHNQGAVAKKPNQPTKIYKCMSCDFKTVDLKQFQPHYETCKQQSTGYRCKICKKLFTNMNALKVHTSEKHSNEYACSICSINYQNEAMLRKHMETNHPDIKTIESSSTATGPIYSCSHCAYKTPDKQVLEEHQRKHTVKVRPFKCRLCSQRFETREQASVHAKSHQPDYFKCGKCNSSFPQRELLMKHFETHKPQNSRSQQQLQQQNLIQQQQVAAAAAAVTQQQQQDLTTQKLLQDTIDEALRETSDADSKIHFFSCNICSLTFIQENYYNQHMETHKRDGKKPGQSQAAASSSNASSAPAHSLIKHEYKQERSGNATVLHSTQPGSISDADIESMFEKMHSDKVDGEANAGASGNNTENLVITSQGTTASGISYSISIPKSESETMEVDEHQQALGSNGGNMGIDMPVLDQNEEQGHSQSGATAVSMPSLDDDGEAHQPATIDHLPMDLEEMQNAAESGQIKFILNEDGQILQLDNHIITTDADGNQILVQGTDSEQIQQLLQSVGVLQAGEGDGETFQMIQGENNQMIIVQGDNNEAQLIDASMLNEDGHLVIQQQEGEELPEGMHVVGEDGVQVPVSISYASAGVQGQHEQVEHQHMNEEDHLELQQHLEQQHLEMEQQMEDEQQQSQEQPESHTEETVVEHHDVEDTQMSAAPEMEDIEEQINAVVIETTTGQEVGTTQTAAVSSSTATTTSNSQPNVSSSTGEVFFNIEDLMQQPEEEQEVDGSTAEQK